MIDVQQLTRVSPLAKANPVAAGRMKKTSSSGQQKQKRQQENRKHDEDKRVGVNIDEQC